MECLRTFYRVKRAFSNWFYGTNTQYEYTRTLLGASPICWEADVPPHTIIVETLARMQGESESFRKIAWYAGDHFMQTMNYEAVFTTPFEPPWLWIGGVTVSGETRSCTDELAPYLVAGNVIRMELLRTICPDVLYWRILDPTTLEEVEFPAQGIVIKHDDSNQSDDSSKTS
jgi:hypothetical protein